MPSLFLDAPRVTPGRPTPRHATSFIEAQSVASRRIGFTVTQACPLRCAHCSVSAAPELARTTFTLEFAHRVADQMPALKAMGVDFVDFTGGEPVLARPFIAVVSEAAVRAGMTCGIVTAAHWAKTPERAADLIDRFPHITNWDVSTDVYHTPFVPKEQVALAFRTLREHGRSPQIRVAHHDEISYEEAELIDYVHGFAGRRIGFQPIGPVGRGRNVVSIGPVAERDLDRSPCASTGLLVHNDGAAAPCCAPLSHERRDSPMFVGNAFTEELATLVSRWRVQPLIQTIRIWGFTPLVDWLREAGQPAESSFRGRTCDTCVAMLADPARVHVLNRFASRLDHRLKLAVALLRDFDEPWLDFTLRAEATRYLAGDEQVWAD